MIFAFLQDFYASCQWDHPSERTACDEQLQRDTDVHLKRRRKIGRVQKPGMSSQRRSALLSRAAGKRGPGRNQRLESSALKCRKKAGPLKVAKLTGHFNPQWHQFTLSHSRSSEQ